MTRVTICVDPAHSFFLPGVLSLGKRSDERLIENTHLRMVNYKNTLS
jgi:hypothetical protein